MSVDPILAISGAGPGGLALALELQARTIPFVIYEAAPKLAPLGVGVNLGPHATAVLARLGLLPALEEKAVVTQESAFYNKYGQLIYREPTGRHAGFEMPQLSIHRGDLQMAMLDAVIERAGADVVREGHRVESVEQDGEGVTLRITLADGTTTTARHSALVAADGVSSMIRKQLHPDSKPRYTGYMMWRGTTVMPGFLTGASMTRIGWLASGKLVVYPIRDAVNAHGEQLVNWVAEIEAPMAEERNWNRAGKLDDFIGPFEDWTFDWLDVPAMLRRSDTILEYPMVDQEPLPWWTQGRVTLLGDAAHPMVPRGSNGAAQAILDGRALAEALVSSDDVAEAFEAYDAERVPATTNVVLTNRKNPPDAILREVYDRTGDQPFDNIDDVISHEELVAMSDSYRRVVGVMS